MDELLAHAGQKIKSFKKGDKIKAKLIRVGDRAAYFDIGGKSEGLVIDSNFVEAKNLINNLKPGDEVAAVVVEPENRDGATVLSLKGAALDDFWKKLHARRQGDETIEVIIKAVNPHGLVASLETETAFIPNSQLSRAVASLGEDIIGKHVKTKIIDIDEMSQRIVLSEKAVSEAESIKEIKEAIAGVKEGDKFKGVVTTVTGFGAFVQIKIPAKKGKKEIEVEGLVHVSELSWGKVARPEEVVSVGDVVEVKVLGIDRDKLSLSMKDALKDPWEDVEENYKVDDQVSGRVVRVSDFGVFVELEPGIEGLIHITKIPPATILKEGQKITCYIEEVDAKNQKLALGLVVTSKPVGYR